MEPLNRGFRIAGDIGSAAGGYDRSWRQRSSDSLPRVGGSGQR